MGVMVKNKVARFFMDHGVCDITEICGVNDACTCLRWAKSAEMLKKCDPICGNMRIFANLCISKYSKCINKYSKF